MPSRRRPDSRRLVIQSRPTMTTKRITTWRRCIWVPGHRWLRPRSSLDPVFSQVFNRFIDIPNLPFAFAKLAFLACIHRLVLYSHSFSLCLSLCFTAVIGGAVVGLLCAILLVMFIVYRMRKKDEGSYALDEHKRSTAANPYARGASKELYAWAKTRNSVTLDLTQVIVIIGEINCCERRRLPDIQCIKTHEWLY